MAFGEAFAFVIEDESVMKISRLGEIEEFLEKAMHVRGREKILTAGDVGDGLGGVIAYHDEVIGSPDVFSGKDDVAEKMRVDGDLSVIEIGESQRTGERCGLLRVETPGGIFDFGVRSFSAASAGIERAFRAVGSVGEIGEF